jgi:predicted nucleic acid-binding protein
VEEDARARLIFLDANFLIKLSSRNPDSVWLGSFFKFISEQRRGEAIGIPAPSWGEVLAVAGPATSALSRVVQARSSVQVIPFDEIAAIESGFIHQKILALSGSKKGLSNEPWQRIKIDRQILAIAAARRASAIFTDDDGLRADAALIGIQTIGICDVPVYPSQLLLLPEDESDLRLT